MTENREHLILGYLQGNLSPAEREAFEEWRDQSEEHRKTVADFQRVWQLTRHGGVVDFDADAERQKLMASISQPPEPIVRKLYPAGNFGFRIAATLLPVLASAFVLYLLFFRDNAIVIQTAGNTLHTVLPDGSQVWLNDTSRITYANDFNESRNVKLEGEAFFEVKRDTAHPFVIDAGDARVKVLGTSFQVKAQETGAEVFVVTGRVSLGTRDAEKVIVLTPGNKGVLAGDHQLSSHLQDDPNSLAWKDKQIIFNQAPLQAVVRTLRSYFKKDIRVESNALLSCRFTSSFNDPTLEEVLETLELALDLQVQSRQGAFFLSGTGCHEK